jgi:membrane protein DedA with SNARE-associated domain
MSAELLEWLRDHGAPAVFLLVVLENLGVPWITAPAYAVAAEIVRSGRMSFWAMVGLVSGGHMVGATTAWAIMRAGENRLALFFERNYHLDQAYRWLCRWYARRGAMTLVGGRIVGQIRPWASLAAGMAGVRALPFLLWTGIGSVLYSVLLLFIWLTGVRLWVEMPELRWLIIVLLILGFFGVTVFFGVRHVRGSRQPDEAPPDACALEDATED